MNDYLYMNSKEITACIDDYKTLRDDMNALFSSIKKETDALKDFWDTRTSGEVYNDFDEFYKLLEKIKYKNDAYINYLESSRNSFIKSDSSFNKIVDTNIEV